MPKLKVTYSIYLAKNCNMKTSSNAYAKVISIKYTGKYLSLHPFPVSIFLTGVVSANITRRSKKEDPSVASL